MCMLRLNINSQLRFDTGGWTNSSEDTYHLVTRAQNYDFVITDTVWSSSVIRLCTSSQSPLYFNNSK